MSLSLFFFGSRTVRAKACYRTELLNICLQNGINYSSFSCAEDGSVSFCVSFATARKLKQLCGAAGVELEMAEGKGLPHLVYRYRRRAGVLLGSLIAIVLLVLSERFVWDVRVSGNTFMSEGEILRELKECGFGIGSYIPDVHAGELENRVLLASDRIAWISVYLDGTVARVQVIERAEASPSEDLSRPANLVAAADGQIEVIELYRGNCVVKRGQAVKKGELLVSGLYDSSLTGYRWTRAAGKVLARTEHTITVEIPLSYEEKVYSDAKCGEIALNFFDFSMKIFKNTGNLPPTCDIIKEERGAGLFGMHDLPFGLTVTTCYAYTAEQRTRSHEEALVMAYAALEHRLGSLSGVSELLRKDITTRMGDDSLILECTVLCIEDIAVQSEFEITE